MKVVRTIGELREQLREARSAGSQVGLVPTMGALHAGHLSLIEQAATDCDLVVVSLFVNPTQFNEAADLERYPRSEARDAKLAATAGADLLFAPDAAEMYPPGFATSVRVAGLTEVLEGASRGAAHFHGVCTVVAKLLCAVGPDRAYFGQKDAQQVLVIRRMARDLDMPVEILALATVREPDGLAMSSRNALLAPDERERALGLSEALAAASALLEAGERDGERLLEAARERLRAREIEEEYLALVDTETLEPLRTVEGRALLVVAARVGAVRLIDNVLLDASASEVEAGAKRINTIDDEVATLLS